MSVDRNDETFYVSGTVELQDDSFDHEFGTEKRIWYSLEDVEVYRGDEKITDEKLIQLVTEHCEENYLDDEAA